MQWLYLYFPCLSLEHQLRYHPEHHRPAVLTDAEGQRVLIASPAARAQGIVPGMGLSTANTLTPDLLVLEDQPEQNQAALIALANQIHRQVAHLALQPPHGLLLELGSMKRLIPSMSHLQSQLTDQVQTLGFQVQAGRGPTPLMAELLAKSGDQPADMTEDQARQGCNQLSVHNLGLPDSTRDALQRVGIHTAGQLLALPTASLGKRFDQTLLHWRARLLGERHDPQTWYTPPERFVRHIILNHEVSHTQGLIFPLKRVFEEFEEYGHHTQLGTDQVHIRLRHRERLPTTLDLQNSQPERRSDIWLRLLRLRLERLTLFEPVIELLVQVEQFQALAPGNDTLPALEQHRTGVARSQLVSQLQARLGRKALEKIKVTEDHRPEHRNRLVTLSAETHQKPPSRRPSADSETLPPPHTPGWLLAQPRPIRSHQLSLLYGPERIETGWWDLNGIKRDYYQARLPDNSLCWVFRRPDDHWFIAGYFS